MSSGNPPGLYTAPEVRERTLRESSATDGEEYGVRPDERRHLRDGRGCTIRQNNSPRQTVLRRLLPPSAVEASLHDHLGSREVEVWAAQCAELPRSHSRVGEREDDCACLRAVVAGEFRREFREFEDLALCERVYVLAALRRLQAQVGERVCLTHAVADGVGP